ncbi:MAG: T9SS type A sorting domain-containing protein [Bacteroidota bacterium]
MGTGLDETSAAAGIVVYPTPVVDILRIATDNPIRTIRVFNIYGREVACATDTDRIDLSHLPAGVYTVRADGKTARVVKK